MLSALPFELKYKPLSRRQVEIRALRDHQVVDVVAYTVGNVKRRTETATAWAANEMLRNGRNVSASDVSDALAVTEAQASEDMDTEDGDSKRKEDKPTEAASYVDEHLIVELGWNVRAGRVDYIVYDRATCKVTRASSVETPSGWLVPPSCCAGIATPGGSVPGIVLVPTEHDETGLDNDRLREDILEHINRWVELPGDCADLAVQYILLSWVFDAFDETPYLCFRTSDVGRGKSRALETVGSVCRLPTMLSGGSTAAAMLRLVHAFGGTLCSDEADQKDSELASELNRLLNAGFQANRPLIRCDGENNQPTAFRCYSPKLFALRKGFADDATESRMISIHMRQRTRKDMPISLPRRCFDQGALSLRNRLLAHRFANLGRLKVDARHADPRLEDRLNQIGLPLMAVAGNDEARTVVVEALLQQQRQIACDRADSLAGEIFESVLAEVGDDGIVRPGDVAAHVNKRRAKVAGVDVDKLGRREVNPWKIGRTMKADLELRQEKKDVDGARYRLTAERRAGLARRFSVDGAPSGESSETSKRQNVDSAAKRQPNGRLKRQEENGLFDSARAASDVTDVSDVSTEGPLVSADVSPDVTADVPRVPPGWTPEGHLMALKDRLGRTDDPDQQKMLTQQISAVEG